MFFTCIFAFLYSSPNSGSFLNAALTTDFKLGCSISFPLTQVLFAVSHILVKTKINSPELLDRIKQIKASDSIKRVGISISLYYNIDKGLRYSIGPYSFYLPGMRMRNKLLPLVMTFPAFFAALLEALLPFLYHLAALPEEIPSTTSDSEATITTK